MEEGKKRCFVALDLPREAINEIKRIQDIIKKKNLFAGKFIEPENLHLTLKFLGEVDGEKIEKVREKLKEIKFNCFESGLGEVGVFSSRYNSYVRVIWVKLNGKGVFDLQKQIDETLSGLFEPEFRFMSHITIARVKHVFDRKRFLDYVKGIKIKRIRFEIDKFFLKKSELFADGPVYTDLREYKSING